MQVRFIKTAVLPKDWPELGPAEVAMVGRSNAGKSSLINAMSGSKTAKVSSTPGKTRALNFFDINGKYRLVDMPGYGYAARPGAELKSWQQMIENFLYHRPSLVGLVLVMDIRRKWTEDEQLILEFMREIGRPLLVALTKADKVGGNEKRNQVKKLKEQLGMSSIIAVSNTKKLGSADIEDHIYKEWVDKFEPMNPYDDEEEE